MHAEPYDRPGIDRIDWAPLADGEPGTVQTLRIMAELVRKAASDPAIRDEALAICHRVPGHDFAGEIEALFHFCQHHITYRRDPLEQERVQDALRTIKIFRSGDCDDKCVALNSLLSSLGHRTRFKVIGKRPGIYTHVYCQVFDRNRGWVSLDPTPETAPLGWEARGYHAAVYEIFQDSGGPSPCLLGLGLLALWWFLK